MLPVTPGRLTEPQNEPFQVAAQRSSAFSLISCQNALLQKLSAGLQQALCPLATLPMPYVRGHGPNPQSLGWVPGVRPLLWDSSSLASHSVLR